MSKTTDQTPERTPEPTVEDAGRTGVLSAPKGTYDLLPPRSEAFAQVTNTYADAARRAGYGYVATPMFEDTALFQRGVGESTDVVSKEMYTFEDRGGRSLTLRPEGTAGVMRAVVEHRLLQGQLPVKLWYTGPNFRYEQPQSGRYRQHVQVGIEAVGVDDPALDAEVVAVADEGVRRLGLTDYDLRLTSLGCERCRPAYRSLLVRFLDGLDLDEATRARTALNPLRVLDDKRPEVRTQLEGAPLPPDHLCEDCAEHFATVRSLLESMGVAYLYDPFLVRGLDYYTRTTFELTHRRLGAQASIGGGGRYNGLVESIGGPAAPGVGYGLGVDRSLLACEAEGLDLAPSGRVDVFGVALGPAAKARLVVLLAGLRDAGVRADLAYGDRGMKGSMKAADRSGARYAVVLGERDLAAEEAQVKDLTSGEQVAVPLDRLVVHVAAAVG
ncbi:MAG TPA: histidine--tRNA ligase [Actinomycetales bacterium]|nr:histidine--tRNA ligase [Actinomycetales bacterium]